MTKLSPEEFVLRAVERLPSKGSGHTGLRKSELERPFKRHFRTEFELGEILHGLIQSGKVVAVHLVWSKRPDNVDRWRWTPHPEEVERLHAFPDSEVEDSNPVLYPPSPSRSASEVASSRQTTLWRKSSANSTNPNCRRPRDVESRGLLFFNLVFSSISSKRLTILFIFQNHVSISLIMKNRTNPRSFHDVLAKAGK